MPRKKMIYTDCYPYHITARANNKEWFYIPKKEVWEIFIFRLNKLTDSYQFKVHAFVLMDNHYHLVASTSHKYNLGFVMQRLQKDVSRAINKRSGRINHVFGGPYKGSLMTNPRHYKTVLKYVFRNPVEAGICAKVQGYEFSTLNTSRIKVVCPYSIDCLVTYEEKKMLLWLNKELERPKSEIYKGLRKTEFKPVIERCFRFEESQESVCT